MSKPRHTSRSSGRAAGSSREQALVRLRMLVGALSHSARAVERSVGITNAQLFLLQQLSSREFLSVNDLASLARTQQSAASIVVARLVRAGLAAKKRSADDGRLAVVTITSLGRRLLHRAPAPPTAALLSALEKLSDTDARNLSTGLRALVDHLDLAPPEVNMLFEHAPKRRTTPTRSVSRKRGAKP